MSLQIQSATNGNWCRMCSTLNRNWYEPPPLLGLLISQVSGQCESVNLCETATNIASDFADLHPNVKVVGTDVSPLQPAWVPPNV